MMALRRADIMDVDGIYEVELDSFSIPWSKNAIEEELTDTEGRLYFVAEEDGVVLGYAGAWPVADEGQITNIAVRKAHRGEGYGTMLTRKLVHELFKRGMNEIFLEVRLSNMAAQAMYRRLGFTVKGLRKGYYTDPLEDAYIMSLAKEAETEA